MKITLVLAIFVFSAVTMAHSSQDDNEAQMKLALKTLQERSEIIVEMKKRYKGYRPDSKDEFMCLIARAIVKFPGHNPRRAITYDDQPLFLKVIAEQHFPELLPQINGLIENTSLLSDFRGGSVNADIYNIALKTLEADLPNIVVEDNIETKNTLVDIYEKIWTAVLEKFKDSPEKLNIAVYPIKSWHGPLKDSVEDILRNILWVNQLKVKNGYTREMANEFEKNYHSISWSFDSNITNNLRNQLGWMDTINFYSEVGSYNGDRGFEAGAYVAACNAMESLR